MRNDEKPECMLPILLKASAQWKKTWEEDAVGLDKPLRTMPLTLLLTELGSRARTAMNQPDTINKMTEIGWMHQGEWIYQCWDHQKEELVKDEERKPVSHATFVPQVQKALLLVVIPENLRRFQAARRLTAEMKGPPVTFLLDVGLRTQADELRSILQG